jgi:hypothetical protein
MADEHPRLIQLRVKKVSTAHLYSKVKVARPSRRDYLYWAGFAVVFVVAIIAAVVLFALIQL